MKITNEYIQVNVIISCIARNSLETENLSLQIAKILSLLQSVDIHISPISIKCKVQDITIIKSSFSSFDST